MSEKQTRPGPRIDLTSTHSSRKESKVAFVQCCCSPVSTGTTYDYSIVHLDESLKQFIRVTHTYAHTHRHKVPQCVQQHENTNRGFVQSVTAISVLFNRSTTETKLSLKLGKCFSVYIRQAIQEDVCLHEGFLRESTWKSVTGAKVGWITSDPPDPVCWHFGPAFPLYPHLLVSHSNPNLHPCQPLIPLFFPPHLHPELQWSKMEHSNYSLVELKIANNCVCVCVWGESAYGPVFCVSPAMATGLCWWASPLLLQTFLFINIKENCPHQYC